MCAKLQCAPNNFIIEDMRGLKIDMNFSTNVQRWMASQPQTQITWRQGGNGDCRTPGVVNTGTVDVVKIWRESPQWLPQTSLANFQIMGPKMSSWLLCKALITCMPNLVKQVS